jgi:hypothetical protein
MAEDSTRRAVVEALMDKVDSDPYPSSTMLDILESMLRPDEVGDYAELLLRRVRGDRFPSISLLQRLQALT